MLAGFAAVIGVLAVRKIGYGLAGLAAFAGAGRDGRDQPARGRPAGDVVPTLVGVAVAAAALAGWRDRPAARGRTFPATRLDGEGGPGKVAGQGARQILVAAGGAAALAAGRRGGELLLGRFSVASSRSAVRLPAPAVLARAVPAGTELSIPGLTPFFTPNASFYRVDTDLVLPRWRRRAGR